MTDRLYGVPLYADVSCPVLEQGPVPRGRARSRGAADEPPGDPRDGRRHHRARRGNYGYYLPGNCAGCNIFTFGPLIWSSGGTIEPAPVRRRAAGRREHAGRARVGATDAQGRPHRPGRAGRDRRTFAEQFGSGKVGIMGTGNFNVVLAKQQNPDIELGVTLLPGLETGQVASFAGGDIVTIPKGSQRVEDAVDFMKFILSDEVQVEVTRSSAI